MNIQNYISELIKYLGDDPDREGLKETPKRVERSLDELFSGYKKDPKEELKFFDAEDYDEMVLASDIDFFSTCEHHMLPFYGKAYIGYIPNKKIIGVSKFARIIEAFSRKLQNQERLTDEIANFLNENLEPKGIGVIMKAKHLCMISRGVKKQNSFITTSSFRGLFKKNQKTRHEFLDLIKN